MYKAIAGQTIISTSTFVFVALYGYVSFLEATKGNVADNYPNDIVLAIIRCIFGVSVITGFPMNVFPCRLSLDNLILETYYFLTCRKKPEPVDVRLAKKDETLEDLSTELMPENHPQAKQQSRYFDLTFFRYCIETLIIGITSFLLAIFFPRVEVIFSLTGSTAAAMTCIVFPCLFYIKCCQRSWFSWQVIGSILLLLSGLSFGLIVTVSQIYALVISKQ
jgi:amino acid permease